MDTVSIILPVYNEKNTIENVLQEWKKELDKYKVTYTFIVCEDGSTDGTKELLLKIKQKYKLVLNERRERRGYGGAVIDGIISAKSQFILCIDSDGQCDPRDFKTFWKIKGQADIIMGWRVKRADTRQRLLMSGFFKMLFKVLFPTSLHDPSAPFVLFKRGRIIPYMRYLRFMKEGFWWGFIAACLKKKLSIIEIPIQHQERFYGKTRVYRLQAIPRIASINIIGLVKLYLAK